MGKSSKAPPAPDPRATAQADAEFNRFDVYAPGGGGQRFGYTQDGQFVQGPQPPGAQAAIEMRESPFDAWLRQSGQGITTNLSNLAQQTSESMGTGAAAPTAAQFSDVALPTAPPSMAAAAPTAPNDAGAPARASANPSDIPAIEAALFERGASLMRPEVERQDNRLQTRLQGMGIPIGSEAWNDSYGQFTDNVNDAWGRLSMDAVMAGGQEQSRRYGLQADARARALAEGDRSYGFDVDTFNRALSLQDRDYNYGVDQRGRAISDATTFYDLSNNARGRDFSEMAALLGGSFTPVSPMSNQNPSTPRVDVQGPINQQYQSQLAGWQQGNANSNAMWGNLASLGGAFLISTRDAKHDLGEIDGDDALAMVEAMPIHRWRYRAEEAPGAEIEHIGPFAEDFHAITGTSGPEGVFPTDPAGLALAAVKQVVARIGALEARIEELEAA